MADQIKYANTSSTVPFNTKVGDDSREGTVELDEEYIKTYYPEEPNKTTFLYSESIFFKVVPSPESVTATDCNNTTSSGLTESKTEIVNFSDTSMEFLKYVPSGIVTTTKVTPITETITASGREVAVSNTRITGAVKCKYDTSRSRLTITCPTQVSGATDPVEGTFIVKWSGDPKIADKAMMVTFNAPPPPDLFGFAAGLDTEDLTDHPVKYPAGSVSFGVKNKSPKSPPMGWSATTTDTWATISNGLARTGDGTFNCAYTENPSTTDNRVATITITSTTPNTTNSPFTVTITQEFKAIVLKNVRLIIKNVATGTVIEDATVTIAAVGKGSGGGTEITDSDGQVTFTGVTAGEKYNLTVTHIDYVDSGTDYLNNDYFTVPV